MKITSIRQQVKQAGRYSVYVEGKYAFSLSESALMETRVTSGQELDTQQVEAYKQLSAEDKVYNRALRYVAMRQRSVGEVRDYLRRKEAPDPLIDNTIEKLSSLKLLDDIAYAQSFVRDRRMLRSSSKRKLIAELRKKRVDDTAIELALANDETDDSSALKELIIRKRRQSKYQDDIKLMQYLARQGFGYSDIKAALEREKE